MPIDEKDAPPGYRAILRNKTVSDSNGNSACLENGGCAFADACAPKGSDRGCSVPGFWEFSCRPGFRKDHQRVLFKRATYGNEED